MKIDWRGLAEGIRNKVIPPTELRALVEQTHEERMSICNDCEFLRATVSGPRCGKCGCFLNLKTRCLKCECPIQKWLAVAEDDISQLVKQTLNDNNS